MAAMYAVYHGAPGLRAIATKVHFITQVLAHQLKALGYAIANEESYFDALTINVHDASALHQVAEHQCINLRRIDAKQVGVTVDESVTPDDLVNLINVFAIHLSKPVVTLPDILGSHVGSSATISPSFASSLARTSQFLHHPVFNTHHSETEMLRYIHHLQSKDLSLVHGMIPLGSCTMKLNSTSSMIPVTYPGFGSIHPFAPIEQAQGYQTIIKVSSLSIPHPQYILTKIKSARNWRKIFAG
jgi:glycine cleavage system P protein (glycine dehydrogenase)